MLCESLKPYRHRAYRLLEMLPARLLQAWLPEHFAALNGSKVTVPMKFAAFLALHTGQRRGDLIALCWRQYDGKGISLIQSKSKKNGGSGRRVYIPATKRLKTALDALRAGRIGENGGGDVGELHILTAARGDAYTPNGFCLAWEHAFSASGIKPVDIDGKTFDLHFHDIHGTAVTMLAEASATVPEICDDHRSHAGDR